MEMVYFTYNNCRNLDGNNSDNYMKKLHNYLDDGKC